MRGPVTSWIGPTRRPVMPTGSFHWAAGVDPKAMPLQLLEASLVGSVNNVCPHVCALIRPVVVHAGFPHTGHRRVLLCQHHFRLHSAFGRKWKLSRTPKLVVIPPDARSTHSICEVARL